MSKRKFLLVGNHDGLSDDHLVEKELRLHKHNKGIILKWTKNVITSDDLERHINPDVSKICITCDTLNLYRDFPEGFRGKDLFIKTDILDIQTKIKINLSGRNGVSDHDQYGSWNLNGIGIDGKRGCPGENGGNCQIFFNKVNNYEFLTITSNGGNGSDGQNGGDGKPGEDGPSVLQNNFFIDGVQITSSNFELFDFLRSKENISLSGDPFNDIDGLEKQIVCDPEMRKLLMLVKGSKGKKGKRGGFGGLGGKGGNPGRIEFGNIIADGKVGQNGRNGKNGFSGHDGPDGFDAFVMIRNNCDFYEGLGKRQKYKLLLSEIEENEFSIYNSILKKFFNISEIYQDSPVSKIVDKEEIEKEFFNSLICVIKNSGELFYELRSRFKIKKFLTGELEKDELLNAIYENHFDLPDYDTLKHYTESIMSTEMEFKEAYIKQLREYIKPHKSSAKGSNVIEIKGKILTSGVLNDINTNFKKIDIICDIIHLRGSLADNFRGKSIEMHVNTIHIHDKVEWDLSGLDGALHFKVEAKEGVCGADGQNGEDGGDCLITYKNIINPTFWTIITSGGNGSNGQNGANGCDAVNGKDPEEHDFKINGNCLNSQSFQKLERNPDFWNESGMIKSIYIESDETYLMLVEGSKGIRAKLGSPGGNGGTGGNAGAIKIQGIYNNDQEKIIKISSNGCDGNDGNPGKLGKDEYRDGCGAFLCVKNGVKNYGGLNKLFFYEINDSLIKFENSVKVGEKFYYPKMTHLMQSLNSSHESINIGINLISVLRNAFEEFNNIVGNLQLQQFSKNKIKFEDLLLSILSSKSKIDHFKFLQESAKNYKKESDKFHNIVRNMISTFIKEVKVSKALNIMTVKKKILLSSEFYKLPIEKDIEEIHIICDTLHINHSLPKIFRGKNLFIFSNFVFIHEEYSWDLSGCPVNEFKCDAGQYDSGKGKDGRDGLAGNSGGHFILDCKFVENLSLLTITSNGSDGGNGQNGGPGRNGNDGQDANYTDFYINGVELTAKTSKQKLDEFKQIKKLNFEYEYSFWNKCYRGKYTSDNGLEGTFYYYNDSCIILVHGGQGKKGATGGVGGYGGDGGYGGKITLICQNLEQNLKITVGSSGAAGKKGKNGSHGFHGREGGDIYKYEQANMKSPFIDGINYLTKMKIVETLAEEDSKEHYVYNLEKKNYIHVEEDSYIKTLDQPSENKLVLSRQKSSYAVANENKLIDIDAVKNEHKAFLDDSITEVAQDIKEAKAVSIEKIKRTKNNSVKPNPNIDLDSLRRIHGDFLEAEFKNILNNSKLMLNQNQKQSVSEKFQISESRLISCEKSSIKKNVLKNKSKKLLSIAYNDLCNAYTKKTATVCIEYLRSTDLNMDQYSFLINNIQSLNIYETQRKNHKEKEIEKNKSNLISELRLINESDNCKCVTLNDIIKLCKNKMSFLICKEIYDTFSKPMVDPEKQKSKKFSFDSPNFGSQVSFLRDTKEFKSKSEYLNQHFGKNPERDWNEIFEYLQNNIKNDKLSIAESIFNHLINHISDYKEISNHLSEVDCKIIKLEESCCFENESESKNTQEEFSKILQKFYENKKVMICIKNELKTKGVHSIIYRKMLAHKYGLKLIFCKYNLKETVEVSEVHNDRKGLRYSYDILETDFSKYEKQNKKNIKTIKKAIEKVTNTRESSMSLSNGELIEIFILINNKNFTILEYNDAMYEAYRYKESANINFTHVSRILKSIPRKGIEIISSAFREQNFVTVLKNISQNLFFNEHQFSTIFQPNIDANEIENLFDIIISNFDKVFYTIVDNNLVIQEFDKKNVDKISESTNFYEKDEKQDHLYTKKLFKFIADIDGISILRAIAVRFNSSKNFYSLQEFCTLLNAIIKGPWRFEKFVDSMTFMILGLDQNHWIPELILLKASKMFSKINMREDWEQILKKEKLRKIVHILLEKMLYIDELKDDETFNQKDFNQLIKNLDYFDDSILDILENTRLKLWSTITTDAYWNIHINKLSMCDEDVDELKTILEDISSLHGVKARELLALYIKNIDVIKNKFPKFNINNFSRNFTNGTWHFGGEAIKIMENNSINEWKYHLNFHFGSEQAKESAKMILDMIENADETSPAIKSKIENIRTQIDEVKKSIKTYMNFSYDKIETEVKQLKKQKEVLKILAVIITVINKKTKVKFRETQLISILIMLNSDNGVLMQVSTGEGKTFIGLVFGILKVLLGEKVDIVTSSVVLAKRDSTSKANKQILEFFNVSVDHNCHEESDQRKQAYECQIVYGTLSNFQRDYLLTEFYEQKIMSNHHFQNIIIDEVDSMLLDKGNNILYLSQDLPDLDEILKIFEFIYLQINQHIHKNEDLSKVYNTKLIRNMTLDNIYGILNEDIIEQMGMKEDKSKIIKKLKDVRIIDDDCLIDEEVYYNYEYIIEIILEEFENDDIVKKIKKFCNNKIRNERYVKIPKHLKPFVIKHLDRWIENGIKSLFLQNQKEFIVDTPRSAQLETNPNINIIDLHTGTDMVNSQWDEGLHQFIQIKYGCKLSPLSLKSVFISNVSIIMMYSKSYGMTGTLGNLQERLKMTKIYKIDFLTVPRHMPRKFTEWIPIVKFTKSEWLESISNEVTLIIEKNRSVLIICNTIDDTKTVQKTIKSNVSATKLLMYQRDFEKFDIKELEPGHVIISTNLAGRGTDIKLSKKLNDNGGLHVILTNLPDNSRIEEQALGRAARSGEKGSGRLIIWTSTKEPISKLKEARNQNELQRLDEMSKYYENFIKIEEKFFRAFQNAYKKLKEKFRTDDKEIYLLNFVIQWSFWLDQNSGLLDEWKSGSNEEIIQEKFDEFISRATELHPVMKIEWIKETIARSNGLTKYKEKIEKFSRELKIGDDLLALKYSKLFEMIKTNQRLYSYRNRHLTQEEYDQIRKCLKTIQLYIDNCHIKIDMIKFAKQKGCEDFELVDGYENQQREIIEIYQEFYNSLKKLMGEDVNEALFGLIKQNTVLFQKQLYEELLQSNCIKPPKLIQNYSDEDLNEVCLKNNVKSIDLKGFLENEQNQTITSKTKFENKLIKTFQLPNRIEFWDELIKKGVLKDELVVAIVDMNIIKYIDPSAGEIIIEKCENEFNEFAAQFDEKTIFFSYINANQDKEDKKLVIQLSKLQAEFKPKRFDFLKDHNVFETNKRATLNIEGLKTIESKQFFGKFDRIQSKDMEDICDNYTNILNRLTNLKIISPCREDPNSYGLVHKNFVLMENENILGEDFIYHSKVHNLLKHKFAYTIALESVIEDSEHKLRNYISYLEIHPHSDLFFDLFKHFIFDQAKVDEAKIKNCDNLFRNKGLRSIFDPLDTTKQFEIELKTLGLIDSECNVLKFDMDKVTLSDEYNQDQSTILLMLHNRSILVEEIHNIKLALKSWIAPLARADMEFVDVSLKPIEEILPGNSYIHIMKLKGMGSVIKVEEKLYSFDFWMRFTITVAVTMLKICISFTLSNSAFGLNAYGVILFTDGIQDMIFALAKLKSGKFTFSEFNVFRQRTLSKLFIKLLNAMNSSKQKWLKTTAKFITDSNFFGNQAESRIKLKKEGARVMEGVNSVLIKSEQTSNAYILIGEYVSKLTDKIINDVSKNIQEGFTKHHVSKTIQELLTYMKEGELRKVIEGEFPEIKNAFNELKNIQEKVSNIVENLVNLKSNKDELFTAGINLVANSASIKDSVNKIFNSIDESLKNILLTKKGNKKFVNQKQDLSNDFNTHIIKQLEKEARSKCRNTLFSYVVNPAMNHAVQLINNERYKCALDVVKKSANLENDSHLRQNAMKLHEGMETSNYSSLDEDLTKEKMLILTRANDYHKFKSQLLKHIPLDEICVEILRMMIEKVENKDVIIQIVRNGTLFEFGQAFGGKELKINIKYSKITLYEALCAKYPQFENSLSSKNICEEMKNIIKSNPHIQKSIKGFNNGIYKEFRFIENRKYISKSRNKFGYFEDLEEEFKSNANDVITVHVPEKKEYEFLNKKKSSKKRSQICGLVLPQQVYSSLQHDEKMSMCLKIDQITSTSLNYFEKAIIVKFANIHNAVVKHKHKYIRELHSNMENLIYFFVDEEFVTEGKKQLMLNILLDLALSRTKEVNDLFLTQF